MRESRCAAAPQGRRAAETPRILQSKLQSTVTVDQRKCFVVCQSRGAQKPAGSATNIPSPQFSPLGAESRATMSPPWLRSCRHCRGQPRPYSTLQHCHSLTAPFPSFSRKPLFSVEAPLWGLGRQRHSFWPLCHLRAARPENCQLWQSENTRWRRRLLPARSESVHLSSICSSSTPCHE